MMKIVRFRVMNKRKKNLKKRIAIIKMTNILKIMKKVRIAKKMNKKMMKLQ
jgi:hypothetical protein